MGSPGCLGTVLGGLVIAVVAVLALVAVGIALLLFDPRSPFRDEDPDLSEVSAAADDAARGLTIGSCVDDPFGDEQIIVGDCAVPHGAEAFRILRVEPEESDDYPGGGELQDFGGEHCEPYFQDLSVVRTWTGTLKFTTAYSSEAEWAAGDRYLVCLLVAGVREPLPPGQVVLG